MPWDRPSPPQAAVQESPAEEIYSPPQAVAQVPAEKPQIPVQVTPPAPESHPKAVEVTSLQNYLKKTLGTKPAVAAYLGQACRWEVAGEVLKVWFDNQVAFNLVKPEESLLTEALGKVAMGVKNVEILEWEEDTGPTVDLDDFDRQVDLIAQVFRGERIMEKLEGEKK